MASRIDVLLAERDELKLSGEAIYAAADKDGRDLTAEEIGQVDAIKAKIADKDKQLEVQRARREFELTAPAVQPVAGFPSISGGHDLAGDKPWGYDLGVRMVPQADGRRVFGGVKHAGETALGECLQSIFRAGSGGAIDQRLIQAAASGGNTSDPAAGGFSVGTDLSAFLFQMGVEASILLPYCNTIEISADADGIEAPYVTNTSRATGSRFGGVRVYRRKEAATVTASYPEEEKFELRLSDLMGIAYQTDRLISDARAMGQIYATAFRNEFAFVIDDEIIRGDGVGQCQGVLNSPALVSVTKESGQAAATIVWSNLSKMWIRLPARSKSRATWFVIGEAGPELDALSIPAGTSALEPRFVNYGPDGIMRIKGRPVVELEQCAALGTVGDLLLLDLSEYLVIRKGALEQAESDHVRFLYNERTFRWTQRINGKSPWRTAITPFKASATLSPFVALQTRS